MSLAIALLGGNCVRIGRRESEVTLRMGGIGRSGAGLLDYGHVVADGTTKGWVQVYGFYKRTGSLWTGEGPSGSGTQRNEPRYGTISVASKQYFELRS